jgi:nucleotide-binding universal stress UspA family protein
MYVSGDIFGVNVFPMKKVLVPTDFSVNSKAGLRFALQWSTQQKLELVFVHVFQIVKLAEWTDGYYLKCVDKMKRINKEKLEKFVAQILKSIKIKPVKYSCFLIEGISPDLAIMEYCRQNPGIDFICISTRGAGKLKRIFGTNTGNLITRSKVPVIAIPGNYRVKPIKHLLYATDLRNCTEELKKVVAFARPLKTSVEILHFTWPGETLPDKNLWEKIFRKQFSYALKLHFEKTDITHSLVQRLQKQIQTSRPSVVIMFTDQDRTLYQRIFLSSKAEQLSFHIKVPLLVFNKNQAA